MLKLSRVVVYYGAIRVLKHISLNVNAGEIVCLLGGNASGKSTTMKTILGLIQPTEGTIEFEGQRIDHSLTSQIIELGISPVPEARRVFAPMTVEENLLMGAYARRRAGRRAVQIGLERSYAMFPQLAERRTQLAGTLSGGEQQMLAIGRALMAAPRLLLMDEPSMGLAPAMVERVFEVITRLNRDGVTMFLVEQNATMALSIANRGYVLQQGTIVLHDRAANLLKSDAVRLAYLGETTSGVGSAS